MGKRSFHLNEEAIQQLREREAESRNSTVVRRLQAVRLYGSGRPVADIRDVTGSSESSLRRWVRHYQQQGVAGLAAHPERSAYNARKLSAEQRADLRQRLTTYRPDQVIAPNHRRSHGAFWTVSDLRWGVEHWYGIVYADQGSYRNLFHDCGFSYQRAERIYKSRPSAPQIADFEAELEKK